MLRAVLALLLLANVLFFAWSRGAFAPALPPLSSADREPARLRAQIAPDRVAVLPAQAASAAVAEALAPPQCLEAGPYDDAGMAAAEAALAQAGVSVAAWTREVRTAPPVWLVYAGRPADPAVQQAREAELRRLEIAFETLTEPDPLAPGIVVSRHDSSAAAEAAREALPRSVRIRVRVVALPPHAPQTWLRIPSAGAALQSRLRALPDAGRVGGAAFKPCAAAKPS